MPPADDARTRPVREAVAIAQRRTQPAGRIAPEDVGEHAECPVRSTDVGERAGSADQQGAGGPPLEESYLRADAGYRRASRAAGKRVNPPPFFVVGLLRLASHGLALEMNFLTNSEC